MSTTITQKTDLEIFQALRIEALEAEIQRLNIELSEVKQIAFKSRLSDPIYLKPLSQVNIDYELISQT